MHCMYDISACGLLRRLRSKSTDATDASPASPAMDPVPEEPTPSQGEVTSKGTEGKDAVAAPAGDAAVPKAPGAAPAVPTAPLLQSGMPAVNSSNYRKEYHVLKCVSEGPRAALFPNVAKAFSGTKQEQRDVLKSFLQQGGNLEAVEASVCASRTRSDETEGVRELLTVTQMREKGFSELL